MLAHCISRRFSHIIGALFALLIVYWLCLLAKMDKRLDTPVRVNIGGGVAGYAASNGTNCTIAAATTTTDAITYADVPAEITGATVLVAKATKVENIEKRKFEEDVIAKDVIAWWKRM